MTESEQECDREWRSRNGSEGKRGRRIKNILTDSRKWHGVEGHGMDGVGGTERDCRVERKKEYELSR